MENDLFWQAVKSNDARFDGTFFLGVKTTGIYCKPSCRARLPKRENVDFYASAMDAEAVGFRACLRCKPRSIELVDPQVAKILKAVELLEGENTLSLEDLSAELQLSPHHLPRSFKEVIGVSPKKFAEAKKMEKFKSEIRDGSDVTTATYDAGFGSSSRLYEKASENLGMTPKSYKAGGKGMTIEYTITDCELGRILVGRTIKG